MREGGEEHNQYSSFRKIYFLNKFKKKKKSYEEVLTLPKQGLK